MTYLGLGTTLALAAFLAIDVAASALAAIVWRVAERDLDRVSARSRANGLFLLGVFPATAALIVVIGVLLPAFWKFEPRQTAEMVGQSLVALAVVSGLLIASGARRGWQASRATSQVMRDWLRRARPIALAGIRMRAFAIDEQFPVVSVVGILRPRLFVSERVLRECTAEELAAMLRHECGHLAARDNLKRLIQGICPTVLLASVRRNLDAHWREACEEAADDFAARASAPSAFALANGLLRLARMAPPRSSALHAMTFAYEGDGIERRVRRLVGDGPRGRSRAGWLLAARVLPLVPLVLALAVLVDSQLLHAVHHVIEAVVETLP